MAQEEFVEDPLEDPEYSWRYNFEITTPIQSRGDDLAVYEEKILNRRKKKNRLEALGDLEEDTKFHWKLKLLLISDPGTISKRLKR